MLKDIIKRCAYLLNRNDIVSEIEEADEVSDITNDEVKLDVLKLIDYYNSVTNSMFSNYLDLYFCEKILSNFDSKLTYDRFSKTPVKILKIETENGHSVKYFINAFNISVPSPKTLYDVTYCFVPSKASDLEDRTDYLTDTYFDVVCYGILSEYLAGISKYNESIFWKEKFTTEIFNLKSKKERRIKSTYCV